MVDEFQDEIGGVKVKRRKPLMFTGEENLNIAPRKTADHDCSYPSGQLKHGYVMGSRFDPSECRRMPAWHETAAPSTSHAVSNKNWTKFISSSDDEYEKVASDIISVVNAEKAVGIEDIWSANAVKAFNEMVCQIQCGFTYIAVNCAFPGNPVTPSLEGCGSDADMEYEHIRRNVNSTRPIQIAFSLFDGKGNVPRGVHTWQFNLKFTLPHKYYHLTHDKVEWAAVDFLQQDCHMNFNNTKYHGVSYQLFSALLKASNSPLKHCSITWLFYYGARDAAYMLKMLEMKAELPCERSEFLATVVSYFPRLIDLRYMAFASSQNTNKGLECIANQLGIRRVGFHHHAGSDSFLIGRVFFVAFPKWFPCMEQSRFLGFLYGTGHTLQPCKPLGYRYKSSLRYLAVTARNQPRDRKECASLENMVTIAGVAQLSPDHADMLAAEQKCVKEYFTQQELCDWRRYYKNESPLK